MVIGFRSIEGIMLLTVMVAGFDKNMSRFLHYTTKTNDYMHKCSNNINPNCDHCGTYRGQYTSIYKMYKNKKTFDTLLRTNINKIGREN